jgi:hypothetical protein
VLSHHNIFVEDMIPVPGARWSVGGDRYKDGNLIRGFRYPSNIDPMDPDIDMFFDPRVRPVSDPR